MKRIGELIEIPPVKTVIQLSDSTDPELRNFLTESFLLTDEVRQVLEAFFNCLINQEGKGFFLEGNYGSGKSHLLTVLNLLLDYQESWQKENIASDLSEYKNHIKGKDFLTVSVSLVEHSSSERLEDIIIEGIVKSTNNKQYEFDSSNYKRKDFFQDVDRYLTGGNCAGLVILIDELSEFLRSKPDGRSFNEDIRFLQYMGEYTLSKKCWIMATLQEGIEKTGEITKGVFTKINDRFTAHFHLTGTHIEEIVSERLIKKKSGVEEDLLKVYKYYTDSFSYWPVSKECFFKLYPVNPLSIKILDNLKPLFSQHRGIIDFIHYRLQGDKARNISSMLEEDAYTLLNPDLIFDHFLDRIRETVEIRQYYEKIYRYYEQEIDTILSEEEARVGLKLIKLLILLSISPLEKEYTVQELSHLVLKPVTDLDSIANYEYIAGILERLFHHGAYLVLKKGNNIRENIYSLDLKADVNLIIEQKTNYIKSNFFSTEERLFTKVGKLVNTEYLPLADLLERPKIVKTTYWQNTERKGYFTLTPLNDITLEALNIFNNRLREANTGDGKRNDFRDFVIFTAYPLGVKEQREYMREVILPELANEERSSYCFWIPEELGEIDLLKDILARIILQEEYQDKKGETALAVREKLEALLKEDSKICEELFREAYFKGIIFDGNGEEIIELKEKGILAFDKLVDNIISVLLENRFPDHYKIASYQSIINDNIINKLCEDFLESGEIERELAAVKGLLKPIEEILKTMGLVKISEKKISLSVNPARNPLLKAFFSCLIEEKNDIDEVYKKLRKGNYGLTYPYFKLIGFILLYAGYITAFSEKQKIALTQLNPYNYSRIKSLGYGEIIGEDFQQILKNCKILPPRFKEQPFSLPLQQDIWSYLSALKREVMEELNNYKIKLTNITLDGQLKYIDHEQLLNNLEKVKEFYDEIKLSYSAEEGLERFASAYNTTPNIDIYLERFALIKRFLDKGYQELMEVKAYLAAVPEELPERDDFLEIKKVKEEILTGIQDQAVIFSSGFLEGLIERMGYFKELYIEKYYQDHQKALSGERFRLYRDIEKSRPYQVLKSLAGIDLISVRDDLIKVQRLLARVLRQNCSSLNRDYLLRNPVCNCGYIPGQELEYVSLEEIHHVLASGIVQYLQALASNEYEGKIEEYLTNMEAVGEKHFARPLRELLLIASMKETEIDGEVIEKLYKTLNRNIINRINQALAGDISIVERDLDQLYENLYDRSYSLDQIQQVFKDWLEKGQNLDKYTYIKIVSENHKKISLFSNTNNKEIENFLEEYFPELFGFYDQFGEDRFSLFLAFPVWIDLYSIGESQLRGVVDDFISFYKDLNTDTIFQLWEKLSEENNQALRKRIVENINNGLYNDNLLEQLLRIIPLADIDDMIRVFQKEFISTELIRKVLVLLVKRTEKGLSGKGLGIYIEELEEIRTSIYEEERSLYIELLKNYLKLQLSFAVLENVEEPETGEDWSDLYIRHLSHLEYTLSRLLDFARKTSLIAQLPTDYISRTVQGYLGKFKKKFYDFSRNTLFRINEERESYLQNELKYAADTTLSELILERYPEMTKKINKQGDCCILLDGMRYDNWEEIKALLCEKQDIRILREGTLYANLPSNTETQILALKESGFRGEIMSAEDYILKYGLEREQGNYPNEGIIREIVKFSYIDDKIHTSKEEYKDFMEEILFQTENRLIPFLKKLPLKTIILLISDHGYTINHNFPKKDKYEIPRYLHGGDTFQEIIVPWALIYKL